jgi:NADH dehydrogenase FAD-containing subunit
MYISTFNVTLINSDIMSLIVTEYLPSPACHRGLPEWKGERRVLVVLVVGGGAGGFELAMTMHARLTKEGIPREWPGF